MYKRSDIIEIYKSIGLSKGYKEPKDWYLGIRRSELGDIENRYDKYFNNINDITRAIFPDYCFHEWLFNKVSKGWWLKNENICQYLDWYYIENNFNSIEDWYSVDNKDVIGGDLLSKLKIRYQEYTFLEWRFKVVSNNFWITENIIRYLKWLEPILNFNSIEDWYKLQRKDIEANYGKTILEKYKYYDLPKLLYPEYEFDITKFYKEYVPKWNVDTIKNEIDKYDKFPSYTELERSNRNLLNRIISVYGKYSNLRKSLNVKELKRENGHWNLEVLYEEIQPYIIDETFPTNIVLKSIRYDLVYAIKILGGKKYLAELWNLKISKTCKTNSGIIVRSSYEQLFANCLEELNIEYLYDKKINNQTNYRYDFKIGELYVEIWGFVKKDYNHEYYETRQIKELFYRENGLTLLSIEPETFHKKDAKLKVMKIIDSLC